MPHVKTSNQAYHISLNQCLHKGSSLTPLIFNILLRFRAEKVVLVGDNEKAVRRRNVQIHPEDRDSLRSLWVASIHNKEPQIKVYVYCYKTVVFGVSSSRSF